MHIRIVKEMSVHILFSYPTMFSLSKPVTQLNKLTYATEDGIVL